MSSAANSPDLQSAYAACRAIAKREAKNFYYAFRVLPPHKSDAMCAVYAFMRKADDLADDESMPLDRAPRSHGRLDRRIGALRAPRNRLPIPCSSPLNDTQQRFDIS